MHRTHDDPCRHFRGHLERALTGGPDRASLRALGWHEHLFGCDDCRALLESEEALELLLDSLPDPSLPPDLAARLLARLAQERQVGEPGDPALDRLLARAGAIAPPPGLAAGVLAGLRARRADEALDRLLERVPAEAPPAGLAARVVAGLEPVRAQRTEGIRLGSRRIWAAAAVGLVVAGVWLFERGGLPTLDREDVATSDAAQVDPELLASLDVLENWDIVMSDDVDLWLAGLDAVDELAVGVDPLPSAGDDAPKDAVETKEDRDG